MKFSKVLSGLGYFMVDHRDSPGVSKELAQQAPDNPVPVGAGCLFESDINTCPHCQRVIVFNPGRTRPHDYCAKCDAYTCDTSPCNVVCRPYLQYLDELDKLDQQASAQLGSLGSFDSPQPSPSLITLVGDPHNG